MMPKPLWKTFQDTFGEKIFHISDEQINAFAARHGWEAQRSQSEATPKAKAAAARRVGIRLGRWTASICVPCANTGQGSGEEPGAEEPAAAELAEAAPAAEGPATEGPAEGDRNSGATNHVGEDMHAICMEHMADPGLLSRQWTRETARPFAVACPFKGWQSAPELVDES